MWLLGVIEVFSLCGGDLLDRLCMVFKRMCVLFCDRSVHLSDPSICFVYVFACWKLFPYLRV